MSGYAREWIKGKTISHEVEASRDTLKGFPIYSWCDFSEKILPIDDDDVDGTECIYDVSHFLWRARLRQTRNGLEKSGEKERGRHHGQRERLKRGKGDDTEAL